MNSMNTDTPKISVIVAAYNQERFIGRCLRSLLNQTLSRKEFEIIVVNDGSTDRTAYAIQLFCDPVGSSIQVLENKENCGLSSALNLGIREARGKYIVRVDSDDFVNSNFLNFLFWYLEMNDHIDAVACDYFLVDDEERVTRRVNCDAEPIACGIMFRKEQMVEVGLYDESFLCQEERELRMRFEKKYKIHRLELPLYRYRRHESNITNNIEQMDKYESRLTRKHGALDE